MVLKSRRKYCGGLDIYSKVIVVYLIRCWSKITKWYNFRYIVIKKWYNFRYIVVKKW